MRDVMNKLAEVRTQMGQITEQKSQHRSGSRQSERLQLKLDILLREEAILGWVAGLYGQYPKFEIDLDYYI